MTSQEWDEKTRAGAVAIRPRRPHDVNALDSLAKTLSNMAQAQTVGDQLDAGESSVVIGTYDWRAYLREETEEASRRSGAQRAKQGDKKSLRAPDPAPSVFYA